MAELKEAWECVCCNSITFTNKQCIKGKKCWLVESNKIYIGLIDPESLLKQKELPKDSFSPYENIDILCV